MQVTGKNNTKNSNQPVWRVTGGRTLDQSVGEAQVAEKNKETTIPLAIKGVQATARSSKEEIHMAGKANTHQKQQPSCVDCCRGKEL